MADGSLLIVSNDALVVVWNCCCGLLYQSLVLSLLSIDWTQPLCFLVARLSLLDASGIA